MVVSAAFEDRWLPCGAAPSLVVPIIFISGPERSFLPQNIYRVRSPGTENSPYARRLPRRRTRWRKYRRGKPLIENPNCGRPYLAIDYKWRVGLLETSHGCFCLAAEFS